MVNKLLQKELLVHTSSKTVGENNLGINENTESTRDNAACNWTQITAKTKKDKRQEYDASRFQRTDNYIDTNNRYAPLTKLIDVGNTIPVIINGACLSKKNHRPQLSAKTKSHTNKVRNSISYKYDKGVSIPSNTTMFDFT
jgi:hypothetical protein